MTRLKIFIASLLAACLFFVAIFFATTTSAAPRLYFSPATANPSAGADIQVDIMIDVENTAAFGADATINIPNEITVKSVSNGGFFDTFTNAPVTNGQLELHGYLSAVYATKTGSGTFARLTLTSNKVLGSSVLNFLCNTGGVETEILNGTGSNILSCSSLNQLSLTYPNPTTPPEDNDDSSTDKPTNACGGTCGSNYNCNSGLYCYKGFCKNPDCVSSANCICATTAPLATKKPTNTKPLVKPTPEVVILAETTPYPTPKPSETPEPTPIPQSQPESDYMSLAIWAAIGLIAVTVIVIAVNSLRKRNPPQIPPLTKYPVDPPTPMQGPPVQIPPPASF